MNKNFDLDKVKVYLDSVLAEEPYINSYSDCAYDIYKTFQSMSRVRIKDVEIWLRNLNIVVERNLDKISNLAKDFAYDISSLTSKTRSVEDVYFWALATAIWVYGGMEANNPLYRPRRNLNTERL